MVVRVHGRTKTDDEVRDTLERSQLRLQRERGTDLTIFSPRAVGMGHHQGDAAVRDQVARRVPLYSFVHVNVVGKFDLDRADGRVDALREAAKLVSSIRDRSKVDAFTREVAGMVGVDIDAAPRAPSSHTGPP